MEFLKLSRNKIRLSISMGVLGAIIAGILWWMQIYFGIFDAYMSVIAIPVGIITGFISCLFMSFLYFYVIRDKNWIARLIFGIIFGSVAGAICGFLTGLLTDNVPSYLGFLSPETGFLGLLHGLIIGSTTGFIVTLIYLFVAVKFINK